MEHPQRVQQVLSFANQNPACHLATIDENQPRVRGMLMWFADETGFYFHTASTKKLTAQIQANPKVEVAFVNRSENPADLQSLRVSGNAEILEDSLLEEKLLAARPWLRDFDKISTESKLVIFRITKCTAHFWNMAINMQEDKVEKTEI